ncbi:uncharacterized protein LOC108742089 [Agrilus planipennis]|uniref:Uncharacterized protein LOC108742089 n=1 Tax=Agrilus planipennis TaxID=224129 RepID=A0A1W4X9A3_AGRPL|nr:uncharacterized protein LOC108742089 [Agrilus planipennis]
MSCKLWPIFLFFVLLELVTASLVEDRIPEAVFRNSNGSQPTLTDDLRNMRAPTIYKTDMPNAMRTQVLSYVNASYLLSPDRVVISDLLQRYMNSNQPRYRWNVVINYAAASYYSNYYCIVNQNSDYLLIYGSGSGSNKDVFTIRYISVLVLINLLAYTIN